MSCCSLCCRLDTPEHTLTVYLWFLQRLRALKKQTTTPVCRFNASLFPPAFCCAFLSCLLHFVFHFVSFLPRLPLNIQIKSQTVANMFHFDESRFSVLNNPGGVWFPRTLDQDTILKNLMTVSQYVNIAVVQKWRHPEIFDIFEPLFREF